MCLSSGLFKKYPRILNSNLTSKIAETRPVVPVDANLAAQRNCVVCVVKVLIGVCQLSSEEKFAACWWWKNPIKKKAPSNGYCKLSVAVVPTGRKSVVFVCGIFFEKFSGNCWLSVVKAERLRINPRKDKKKDRGTSGR